MEIKKVTEFSRRVLSRTIWQVRRVEAIYLQLKNISVLMNQLVFFALCDRVFMPGEKMSSSLYTLMFYNVIAYCAAYVKELIEREDWSMYVNIASNSNVRHLAMTATKIVLEWTKAITFIITVVFMLLVFGLEKGLKNYSPTTPYLTVTGFYYIFTESASLNLIGEFLEYAKFQSLEGLEIYYSPLIAKSLQLLLSLVLVVTSLSLGYMRLSLLAAFTNIRVKYREVIESHWQPLQKELSALSTFRRASFSELNSLGDVCAICLNNMSSARVTECQHFFHADCLRKCLKECKKCPICQKPLPCFSRS